MTLSILDISLYEFDVGFTDLILALFCAYWLISLIKRKSSNDAKIIFFGLFASSFFGSIFHFFFPLKVETLGGSIVWAMVAFSIGLVIFGMLKLALSKLQKNIAITNLLPYLYVFVYLCYFFFVNYSFPSIILFYGPVVTLLATVAFIKVLRGESYYKILLAGIGATFIAATVQVFHIDIHPIYFNFNSLYHIIQLLGLYYFYHFFKIKKCAEARN